MHIVVYFLAINRRSMYSTALHSGIFLASISACVWRRTKLGELQMARFVNKQTSICQKQCTRTCMWNGQISLNRTSMMSTTVLTQMMPDTNIQSRTDRSSEINWVPRTELDCCTCYYGTVHSIANSNVSFATCIFTQIGSCPRQAIHCHRASILEGC